jgi:hypothetical protein
VSTETEKSEERKFWQLGEDDQRLLYVTFLGTVAGGVALVLIVGLSLVEAHLIHRYQHSVLNLVLPQILAILAALGANVVASRAIAANTASLRDLVAEVARRAGRESETVKGYKPSRFTVIVRRIGLGIGALLGAVLILGLVGFAAGVK